LPERLHYTHDANGALLKDGLRSYEFDAANRLGNVTTGTGPDAPTTRYAHNALGQRLFKTEPLYAPVSSGSNPADPGVMQTLANFFASLWGGNTGAAAPSASEKLGYTYYYDEDGSLLYELGSGGANSGGSAHYVYLPTPAGPMPIATYTGSKHYAVRTDHLNTPRRLTNSAKQVAWQWAFSAFGDEQPTTARNRYVDPATTPNAGTTTEAEVTFNLRYPGQYFDKESGLNYNYFRSYDARTGRYTQADPIDLEGGWNRYQYADGNPISFADPDGLQARPPRGSGGTQPMFPRIGPTYQPLPAITRSPIEIRPGTNSPGEFGGVPFSGHALDHVQGRGIPASVITNTIFAGRPSPGSRPNTTQYYDPVNNVTVVVNSTTGNVITIRNGPPSSTCIP
jgi:RHS repeat-associated protein